MISAQERIDQLNAIIERGPADPGDGWTDHRIAFLKAAAELGWSGTEVANKLRITRNSAIGKASRIGARFNSDGTGGRGRGDTDDLTVRTKRPAQKGVGRGNADGTRLAAIMANADARATPMIPATRDINIAGAVGQSLNLRISDPGFGGCRWPTMGDGADMRFCCVPTEDTYCKPHARRAYNPTPTRPPSAVKDSAPRAAKADDSEPRPLDFGRAAA